MKLFYGVKRVLAALLLIAALPAHAIIKSVPAGSGGGGGTGTVTSVATGAGLTGGPITTSGTISMATGGYATATALTGTETIPIVQGGAIKGVTPAQIATYVAAQATPINGLPAAPSLSGGDNIPAYIQSATATEKLTGTQVATFVIATEVGQANSWTALQTYTGGIQVNAITSGNSVISQTGNVLNIGNTTDNTVTNFLGTGNVNFTCAVCQMPFLNITGATVHAGQGFSAPSGNVLCLDTASACQAEITAAGNFSIMLAGHGLRVAEGTNAKQGVSTLVGGTLVVANTSITAVSRVQLTPQTLGTVTTPSACGVSARVAATSFTILCSQATDTSVIAWEIFEPAP